MGTWRLISLSILPGGAGVHRVVNGGETTVQGTASLASSLISSSNRAAMWVTQGPELVVVLAGEHAHQRTRPSGPVVS